MVLIPRSGRGRRSLGSRRVGQRMESCESRSLLSATTAAMAVGDIAETPAVSDDAVNFDCSVELSEIDPLIAECWEVKPVWLDPVGLERADDGLGCGVAEDFLFVADDSVVTDAVTDGNVVELEGEVSVYELEDFDPSWVIRGGGIAFEEPAPIDDSFVTYAFDPIPLEDFELSDPVWCDLTGMEGFEDGLGCGVSEDFIFLDHIIEESVDESFVKTDAPIQDDSFVMYPFDPVPTGELELIDPVWLDFSGLDGLGCGVAGDGAIDGGGVDGEILTEETPVEVISEDPEVSVYELEGFDPSWVIRCGVVADETVPLDDSFVMYPFDPIVPGDLEVIEPIWCDFGGLEGLGCDVVDESELEIDEQPVELVGDDLEVKPYELDGFDPSWLYRSFGGSDWSDETVTVDDNFVMYPYDPVAPGDLELIEPIWCDFGGMEGWEDGLGCGVTVDGYLPPDLVIDGEFVEVPTDAEGQDGEVTVTAVEDGDINVPIRHTFSGEGEVSESSDGSEVADGEELIFVTSDLPAEDQNVVDLVWEDFSGTGGWGDGLTEEIPVDIFLPFDSGTDGGSDAVFESTDWLAFTTVLSAEPPTTDATALVYRSLTVEETEEIVAVSDDSAVISVTVDDELDATVVDEIDGEESSEEESAEEVSISGSSDAPELTWAATELEEDLFESLGVL